MPNPWMPDPRRRALLAGAAGLAVAPRAAAAPASAPAPATATGATGADVVLSSAAMRADIRLLYDAYATLHPGLYRHATRGEIAAALGRLDAYAGRDRTLGGFFLAVSAFTAAVRCGHSYPNPVNQTDAVAEALFGGRDRLPLTFVWLDGRMIVTADLGTGAALSRGTEVLEVDGVPARTLLARMASYARTDGANVAREVADLGVPGDGKLGSFDVLRPRLFAVSPAGRVGLAVRGPDGRARTVDAPLLTARERDAALLSPTTAQTPFGWRFEASKGVGVLTMPTWAVFKGKWDWRRFIDDSLDAAVAAKLPGLVVDLRGNGGGLDCGAAVLARLIDNPLAVEDYSRHVRYRRVPDRLAPHLKTWDPSFRDWGAAAVGPDAEGFYDLNRPADEGEADRIAPKGSRYPGRVAVLIGPENASATFAFAALVKRARLGVLVGRATGGTLQGINGGAFFFVDLPATGLEVDLPLIAYRARTPQPDTGVVPDVAVAPTVADLAAGGDAALRRAATVVRGA